MEMYSFSQWKNTIYLFGSDKVNSLLIDDDTRGFCRQCRSRSDCTERAVWSTLSTFPFWIITQFFFHLLMEMCSFSQWKNTIYLFGSDRINSFLTDDYTRSFCGHYRLQIRLHVLCSLTSDLHSPHFRSRFQLKGFFFFIFQRKCIFSQWKIQFIYSIVIELRQPRYRNSQPFTKQ